jgi:hypothetical protein
MKTRMVISNYLLTEESLHCGHCGSQVPMYVVCVGNGIEVYEELSPKVGLFAEHTWKILLCSSCYSVNVLQFTQFADDAYLLEVIATEEVWEYPITRRNLYPSIESDLPIPHPDMPNHIKEDYEEARVVFNTSPRSSSALLRLALQKLCVELGGKGRNLNEDIANLVKNGLPRHIQQALDIVRVIGNESVHPGMIDVRDDPDIAKGLFMLVNEIVEDQIGKLRKEADIEQRYKSLPKSKTDAIETRDT